MTSPSSIALQIHNISKVFKTKRRKRTHVMENVTLDVRAGEFVCLIGPSGCGKSTLLNMIAGFEPHESGSIKTKGSIGFMFQDPTLFPWLKAKDNIALGLRLRHLSGKTVEKKVDEYLRLMNLTAFREAYPYELSGGMRQRISLARLLVLDPDILLMDEPFAALDAQTRDLLHDELLRIWEITKKTVLFITHNLREAICLADRVVLLTASPSRIKSVYPIKISRPRNPDNPEVVKISNIVQKELKEEIDRVTQEEIEYYAKKNHTAY